MEKNNRNGILLGVVAVATLVVTIIGATFAYFTASVSGNAPVNASSYKFAMSLTVSKIAPTGSGVKDLIPVNSTDVGTALTGATNKSACVDKNDYAACVIYELNFTNSGSGTVTLNGTMTPTTNEFANLKYRAASTQAGLSSATSHALSGTNAVTTDLTNVSVPTSGGSYYIMLYIENNANADQPNDKGKSFSATLTFNDATGGSNARLQATFS